MGHPKSRREMAALVLGALLAQAACASTASAPPPQVAMPSGPELVAALGRSDMVWSWNASEPASLPELWTEAPFVGNGMVGAYLTIDTQSTTLTIEVWRADY